MKNRTDLNLGKVFYVWLIYHILDSWLNSLNGYDFYFWLRDTANQPFSDNPQFSWGIVSYVACLDQSRARENIWWIIISNIPQF